MAKRREAAGKKAPKRRIARKGKARANRAAAGRRAARRKTAKPPSFRRNISAPRRLVEERIAPETFELPVGRGEEARRWQESKAAELHRHYSQPLEIPPMPPQGEPKAEGMPQFATSALAALLIAGAAFAFFLFVMDFSLVYAALIAVPVFVAFAIMINGMLESRRR